MWLARDPSGLLFHPNSRQSRPGLILLASLIQAPLSLIVTPDGPPVPVYQGLYNPLAVARSFTRDQPAYLAYILLNIVILLASFHALRAVFERHVPIRNGATMVIVVATGLLLIANDVTKAFFWSPHTQMFNILVPVLAVYATQRVIAEQRIARGFALGMGALVGLGMTAYPFFVVIVACMLLPAIVYLVRAASATARNGDLRRDLKHEPKHDLGRDLASLAILLTLSAVPSALWYFAVQMTTGRFFSAELDLRPVVWMKDALEQGVGTLLAQWFDYLHQFLVLAAPQAFALAAIVVLLIATVVGVVMRCRVAPMNLWNAIAMIGIGLYVSCAVLGFYTCVGWVADRLAYPAIPPLLVAAGVVAVLIAQRLPASSRTVFAGVYLLVAVGQMIYEVAKIGPWS